MPRNPIYLDHHATTPVDPRVVEAMQPLWTEHFGNAASQAHVYGWRAEAVVEGARETLAAALGAEPREILFTSGATESNNLALFGATEMRAPERDHVVTVATEHRAVLDPCEALSRRGTRVTVLPVDADGLLDLGALREAVDARTAVVSVMAANNEIGVLQPLEEIAAVCREHGAWLHSDAAQAVGKVPLSVDAGIDLLSFTAHKLYGPKGIGALYVRRRSPRVRLAPQIHGGGHERGLRSGTLAVPLIAGFARAVELALEERDAEADRLAALRDRLWGALSDALPGVHRNGHAARRLPGNLNVAFDGVDADALLPALKDVAVSTGSACSSASPEPSHVLAALGHTEARVRGSLRFGLGRGTTADEIETAAAAVVTAVRGERAATGAAPALARRD